MSILETMKVPTKVACILAAGVFGLSLTASSANAQTNYCTPVPTCESLGFTKSAADCANQDTLKCPFDNSKQYCYNLKETGAAKKLGDLYVRDGTLLGIVIYLNPDETSGYVLSKSTVSFTTTAYYDYAGNVQHMVDACNNLDDGGHIWSPLSYSMFSQINNAIIDGTIELKASYVDTVCGASVLEKLGQQTSANIAGSLSLGYLIGDWYTIDKHSSSSSYSTYASITEASDNILCTANCAYPHNSAISGTCYYNHINKSGNYSYGEFKYAKVVQNRRSLSNGETLKTRCITTF